MKYTISNHKKNLILLLLIFVVILGGVIYFSGMNSLEFSKAPGYYDEEIDLKIRGGLFGKVYYTLDGSEPTPENGILYNGKPIKLTDASTLPNRASARTDTSIGFDLKTVKKYTRELKGYQVPDYDVDKGYYIKTRYYDCFGMPQKENQGMFFVNLDERGYYDNISIMSITTDEANLWDYEDGIYCTGKTYDDFKKSIKKGDVEMKPNRENEWDFWRANYNTQEGKQGERPCNVQFFDEGHNLVMDTNCGIRIQGHGSMCENQKSFSIYAREEYANSEYFPVDLTRSGYQQHKYIVNCGGGDQHTKLSDYILGDDVSAGLNVSQTNFRATMMFLNGEFWGFYWIFEPYNAQYVAGHYGINEDDALVYKSGMISAGNEEDTPLYEDAFDFITQNDMSDPENYAKACDMFDMSSFVDYYALMHYLGRCHDWPVANEACWRSRSVSSEPGWGDGRWRWMVFDLNSIGASMDVNRVDEYDKALDAPLWLAFMKNDQFKADYSKRIQDIAYEIYPAEKIDNRIDGYLGNYLEAIKASNKRFYGDEMEDEILYNASEKKYYFRRRNDIVKHMVAYFCGTDYVREVE